MLTNDKVVTFNIHFPDSRDINLDNLEAYLDGKELSELMSPANTWFRQESVLHQMHGNIEDLLQFMEANIDSSIKFIYVIFLPEEPNQMPHSKVKAHCSQGRNLRVERIIPPGKPLSLQETSMSNSVSLSWSPPSHGADFYRSLCHNCY